MTTAAVGMHIGQEIKLDLESGKRIYLKLKNVSPVNEMGTRDVNFDFNGVARSVKVIDLKSGQLLVYYDESVYVYIIH
jgi:pyruvate carboxylase